MNEELDKLNTLDRPVLVDVLYKLKKDAQPASATPRVICVTAYRLLVAKTKGNSTKV